MNWSDLMMQVAVFLLIPIGVGVIVILFQLAFLLASVADLVRFIRFELPPIIKDLRLTVNHLQGIGSQAAGGVQSVSNVGPWLRDGAVALVSGLKRVFQR